MRARLTVLVAIGLLSGCATYNPIPKGYAGPVAKISDSFIYDDSTHSRFFYVSEIDGNLVESNLNETRRANRGKGFSMEPLPKSRDIPAGRVTLKLAARVEYAAPILAILNSSKVYSAERMVELEALPNVSYVVKGELAEGNSTVWLENVKTGERVGIPVNPK